MSNQQQDELGPRVFGQPGRTRAVAWLLFGFLSSLYLLTGKGFTEITDAECYFLITKALVEEGKVSIKPELNASILRGDEPTRDGRAFLHYGIGYPLVMVPFYVVGKGVGEVASAVSPRFARFKRFFPRTATSTALAFITALTGVALYYILLRFGMSLPAAVAGGLIFGLTTYAWPYAKIGFYEPFLSLCQALALLWAMIYAATHQPRWLLFAGFATGWGIAAKPSLILLLPVLVAYVVWAAWYGDRPGRLKRLFLAAGALAIGLAAWVLVVMSYNAARSGAATHMGYSRGNYTPVTDLSHLTEAMFGNTLSTGRGFFVFTPAAILFVLGLPWLWRNRRSELIAVAVLIVLNFGAFATRGNWATMRPWGPRYLVPLAPLFVLLAMPGMIAAWRRTVPRRIITGILVLSMCVQLIAISMPFGTWLDRVKEETGSSFSAVFHPEYAPLWGQIVLLSEAKLSPVKGIDADITFGQPSEAFKSDLRKSPDFWFAYAYRLGLPKPLILLGLLVLLGTTLWLGIRLRLTLRRSPPTEEFDRDSDFDPST